MKILLIEDSKEKRDYYVEILKDEGYQVEATGDTGQVDELFATFKPDYFIIDIMLPPTKTNEGLQVFDNLQKKWDICEKSVLLISLRKDSPITEEIENRNLRVLHKPFEPEQLYIEISRLKSINDKD